MGEACMTAAQIEALMNALEVARPSLPAGRERGLRAVLESLPVEPLPPAAEAVDCRHEKQRAETLALFGGKRWTELAAADLKARWSLHVYLTTRAFEYYLPAFLLSSIGPESTRRYLGGVIFMLRPEWHALDKGLPQSHSDLSERAAKAVALYLETMLDCAGELAWITEAREPRSLVDGEERRTARRYERNSAEALLWRWNRFQTTGLDKVRQWDARMRDCELLLPQEPRARAVAEQIVKAFEPTPPPAADDMTESYQGEEPYEYSVKFRGRDWRRLAPEFLGWNQEALSFLSDAGFRYFIPAFMISELESGGDSAVFHLIHGLDPEARNRDGQYDWAAVARWRFEPFAPAERAAVAAFLEYQAARDDFQRPRIERALAAFWKKAA